MTTFIRLLFLLVVFLYGCKPNFQIASPDVGISPENLNSHIHLVALNALNSFKTNEPIWITIESRSQATIEFPADYGIRVYLRETENWVELQNITTYEPDTSNFLAPYNNNSTNGITAPLLPRLTDITKKAQVRVYIIGNILEDGIATNHQVGTFIDLTLTPP